VYFDPFHYRSFGGKRKGTRDKNSLTGPAAYGKIKPVQNPCGIAAEGGDPIIWYNRGKTDDFPDPENSGKKETTHENRIDF
jgi:hypothetical protein